MRFKIIFILIFISILNSDFVFGQQKPTQPDSINPYKNIETYSKRNKFNKFMYRLIFKPVPISSPKKKVKKKVNKKLVQKPYSSFEGKIIRHINIITLDPFGYSVSDTFVVSQNLISTAGNKLHVKSQHITIRNLLLIRQNQPFNSMLVKESERLVRSMGYVHDVSFFVVATSKKSDSVDIFIRELDNWSIILDGALSTSNFNVNLTDNNFSGLGHRFQGGYKRNFTNGINAYKANYYIPNIKNTFISTTLHYEIDGYKNSNKSLSIDRPFYSPFAKWAGGASITSQFVQDSINNSYLINVPFLILGFRTQDYWAGFAQQIFKGNTETERATNLILAVRYLSVQYFKKPSELNDPLRIYSNEDFYLAGIGISTRKYVQDKYVFKFGVTEDVPVGRVYGLTGGYQVRNDIGRWYAGLRVSYGNYHNWGYLSCVFDYGTFFHSSQTEQGAFIVGVNYFTGLSEIGKWKIRNFVKSQFTYGLNRYSYDSITINKGYGIDGFNSPVLSGTNRLLFTLQTQTYAPWNFIGFRFGPYLVYSLGMLGDAAKGFKNSKAYSQIGVGVLIKNDYFIFNTFQVSISYYPIIPGIGEDVFNLNSLQSTDFGFRDFEFGKPAIVIYK